MIPNRTKAILMQTMPAGETIVSSQIVTTKKHWWSRKRKKLVVMTANAIYELSEEPEHD